jgi:hypothetical protein
MNREKLLTIIEKIIKENVLTSKELKQRLMKILTDNNDTRRVNGLSAELLEGRMEGIKDEDIDILIQNLSKLISINSNEELKLVENNVADEDKILSENYKITELYNESLIKIQKLENDLQEKVKLEKRLEQMEIQLKKFENLNIDEILEENKLYSQMFKITGTQIFEVPDEDIDALYIRYKTQGIKKYGKAFITDNEVIPKTYYDLKEVNKNGNTE